MERQKLEELKVSIYEKLRRAIKEGAKDKALGLLDEIDRNRKEYREGFLIWIDILQSYGADKLGEEFVYETDRIFGERLIWPALFKGLLQNADAEDRLRQRAYVWTSIHGIDLDEIEEDEEKFILKFKCATGGSTRTRGQYGKTKKAYPWSYGEKGFCYYCTHCPVAIDMMPIEQFGYPAWITFPQPEGRCIQHLYKDRKGIPEEYYKRIGMKKPKVT